MRRLISVCVFTVGLLVAPAAFADCVNFSQTRAKAEQDAARRNPLTAAELGVPTLAGLERNIETIGDPQCNGLRARGGSARFKITSSFSDIVSNMHPNIKRATQVDGMGRNWFKNPMTGDVFFLTSGTKMDFLGGRTVNGVTTYSEVMITPATPLGALTPESQPYTINDIADWSPWPSSTRSSREFVRADGPTSAAAPSANSNAAPSAPANTNASSVQSCPPPSSSSNAQGANVGGEIGGLVIGGGFGRNVGNALGGLFGGGQSQQPAPQQTPPNCPR